MSENVKPFRAGVPDDVLADLSDRLARTRWPDQVPGTGWDLGTDSDYLRNLCEYWQTTFDWRAAEARFNGWPQFTTMIDGEQMHFLHARSPEPDATPLLLCHGWPGSVVEFLGLIGPLTDPRSHGADPADAFHVVAPSLPGFGFSGPTRSLGMGAIRTAESLRALMDRLSYDRYFVHGGDLGANAATFLAGLHPESVAALHLNLLVSSPVDPAAPTEGLDGDDLVKAERRLWFATTETGYQAIQSTKPQTLAYGLTDSPAGLAAWIVEKFRTWSDCQGDVEQSFTKDELLTNITLYWVTGTIGSSMRHYYELLHPDRATAPPHVTVPTAYAEFPGEIYPAPRPWAEMVYRNLVRWTPMPRGGHFAALEEPELLVDDIRAATRPYRRP